MRVILALWCLSLLGAVFCEAPSLKRGALKSASSKKAAKEGLMAKAAKIFRRKKDKPDSYDPNDPRFDDGSFELHPAHGKHGKHSKEGAKHAVESVESFQSAETTESAETIESGRWSPKIEPKPAPTYAEPIDYHGPCVMHCSNTFGFFFKSLSADGKIRFSDGVVTPITRGKVDPVSRWRSISSSFKTRFTEYNHVPYKCDCVTTAEFRHLLEENNLGINQFENLKKTNQSEAAEFAVESLKRLNERIGRDEYHFIDHLSLMALILAEMQKAPEEPIKPVPEPVMKVDKKVEKEVEKVNEEVEKVNEEAEKVHEEIEKDAEKVPDEVDEEFDEEFDEFDEEVEEEVEKVAPELSKPKPVVSSVHGSKYVQESKRDKREKRKRKREEKKEEKRKKKQERRNKGHSEKFA